MKTSPLTKTYTPSLAEKMPFKEAREEYEDIDRRLTGYVVNLREVDKVYHRTTPENAVEILESGKLLAQPAGDVGQVENIMTEMISLSVNPSNTYGGAVRFVWDIDDLNVGLEPVLYPYKVDEGSRYDVEELYRKEHFPDMENRNNLRAIMGISPERYKEEAEVMATEDIIAPPEAVELWLARSNWL